MKHYYIATIRYKNGGQTIGTGSISLEINTPNSHEVQKKILELAKTRNPGGCGVEITGVFKTGEEEDA